MHGNAGFNAFYCTDCCTEKNQAELSRKSSIPPTAQFPCNKMPHGKINLHPTMAETTQIHPDKIRAYMATDYRLGHTDNDIIMTIGKRSERLAVLFASQGVDCGAFITAYNPRGATQSDEANDQAHARLAGEIERLGLASIEGSGSEEGTDWPAEYSYFALGLALEPAKSIGTHFDQDAIVWVGSDCVPQLILLR
jgi:hypothetical protein